MKIRSMTYTKDNGDVSEREVIVVSSPRENYLVYDVTKLNEKQRELLEHFIDSIDTYTDATWSELTSVTGIRQNNLWRSFKPGGINWEE